ncbi:MAG: hypothetical protein ACJASV_001850 [Pseudorhodobacter sp.]|jgi:hypothetical protein
MSYGSAAALQVAIYNRLVGHVALAGIPVLDAVPTGTGNGTFILLGPEDVLDRSDKTGGGALHRLVVSIVSDATGFQAAKLVAVAVSDALVDAPLALSRGTLVSLDFARAVARRLDEGEFRRIDLTFGARVQA